jgi:hypothetical protein
MMVVTEDTQSAPFGSTLEPRKFILIAQYFAQEYFPKDFRNFRHKIYLFPLGIMFRDERQVNNVVLGKFLKRQKNMYKRMRGYNILDLLTVHD